MSGLRSRNAGKRWELLCAKLLADLWPNIRRVAQVCQDRSLPNPDIDGPDVPYYIECGFRTKGSLKALILDKWQQAFADRARKGDRRKLLVLASKSHGDQLAAFYVPIGGLEPTLSRYRWESIVWATDRAMGAIPADDEAGHGFLVAVDFAWWRTLEGETSL